jgi:hypothetical protein
MTKDVNITLARAVLAVSVSKYNKMLVSQESLEDLVPYLDDVRDAYDRYSHAGGSDSIFISKSTCRMIIVSDEELNNPSVLPLAIKQDLGRENSPAPVQGEVFTRYFVSGSDDHIVAAYNIAPGAELEE